MTPKRVFPQFWLSTRGVWILLGLCTLTAISTLVPVLLYVAIGAVLVFIVCALIDIRSGPSVDSISVTREVPNLLTIAQADRAKYRIANRSGIALTFTLYDSPVDIVVFRELETTIHVKPYAEQEAVNTIVARERGAAHFGSIYFRVENAIGLIARRYVVRAADEARVFPNLSAVTAHGILARRNTLLELGLRKLRQRGTGTEFESLRDYAIGDAFRDVDWKASARRGHLMVVAREVERSQHILIVLDCGRIMRPRVGPYRKLDYALEAALCVAHVAQAADDAVGFTAFAATPLATIAPRRGGAHSALIAQTMYGIQPRAEEPDYERVFLQLRERNTRRSLIIFFTDIFDPIASASVLASMKMLMPRHLVMCVLMNDASIESALSEEPRTVHDAYRSSIALTLAEERAIAVARLRASGAIVVDRPASQLSIATLDAYLDIKRRARI